MINFTSDNLRLLRHSRGLKQKQAAKKMGISTQRYSELENNDNRPETRTIEILAILGYTIDAALKFLESVPS